MMFHLSFSDTPEVMALHMIIQYGFPPLQSISLALLPEDKNILIMRAAHKIEVFSLPNPIALEELQ